MTKSTDVQESVVKTKEVIGVDVENDKGDNLGAIEEIVLDKVTGVVRYVVLSFGGFLGLGDKLFALPWNTISYDDNKGAFILNVPKEKLEKAPGFDKNNWPNFSDRKWAKDIFDYYNAQPYWKNDDTLL